MPSCRPSVTAAIQSYVKGLIDQGIEVERVYLFGSHARGQAHEWSDVDVIAISRDFATLPMGNRPEITGAARKIAFLETGECVCGLTKTPDEVAACHPASFLAEVLREAVVVYDRDATPQGVEV